MICEIPTLSRRRLLSMSGGLFAAAYIPKFARASDARDPRLIGIILRGAMDGLSAVAPLGDPDYAGLHGELALASAGENAGIALNSFFALNPAMTNFARLYKAGQAAVVHACATGYRDRSHFDGQDVLESGLPSVGTATSGWLNRAIAAIPAGARVGPTKSLAVGATAPLIMRGPAPTLGWSPEVLPSASDDLALRLLDLYSHTDPKLASVFTEAVNTGKLAIGSALTDASAKKGGMDTPQGMIAAARGAAKLMAADEGPRIAAMAFEGWDTHQNEGGAKGRLFTLLGGLDGAIAELETGLGAAWAQTAVVVMTEFGRTAQINGTTGTDHGTGTVAFLAGGAIKGGRVIADWPGLKPGQLYEGRDLAPTTDLRAVLKGLLADQFGLSNAVLAKDVFPESIAVAPMKGLIAG